MDFRLLGPLEVVGDSGLAVSIGTGRSARCWLCCYFAPMSWSQASDPLELSSNSPPRRTGCTTTRCRPAAASAGTGARDARQRVQADVGPGELDARSLEELVSRARAQLKTDPDAAARKPEAFPSRAAASSDLAYSGLRRTRSRGSRSAAGWRSRPGSRPSWPRGGAPISWRSSRPRSRRPLREQLHGLSMLALYHCDGRRRLRGLPLGARHVDRGGRRRAQGEAPALHGRSSRRTPLDAPAPSDELPAALDGGPPARRPGPRAGRTTGTPRRRSEGREAWCCVSGPRGIGKTRAAAELARTPCGDGWRSATRRPYSGGRGPCDPSAVPPKAIARRSS